MKSKSPDDLRTIAEISLQKAVWKAIEEHAKTNDSVVIYRNGKVVEISAKSLLQAKRKK